MSNLFDSEKNHKENCICEKLGKEKLTIDELYDSSLFELRRVIEKAYLISLENMPFDYLVSFAISHMVYRREPIVAVQEDGTGIITTYRKLLELYNKRIENKLIA